MRLHFVIPAQAGIQEMGQYFIYTLASKRNGTLYIGVTNNLLEGVNQHKNNLVDGFTKKYDVYNLVYYEAYKNINDAIAREKCMKKWKRKWKLELIESSNPNWEDLYYTLSK